MIKSESIQEKLDAFYKEGDKSKWAKAEEIVQDLFINQWEKKVKY